MKLKTLVSSLIAVGMMSSVAYAAATGAPNDDATLVNLKNRIAALESTINRNQDNAVSSPSSLLDTDWYKAITISGEFQPLYAWNNRQINKGNTAAGSRSTSGTTTASFVQKGETSSASMNTMELYLDAQVNNFTKVHTALNYGQAYDQYSKVSGTDYSTINNAMFFSEANIQFADLAQNGFYSIFGQQFFNFGSYQHDSISTPMTEILTKTVGIGATGGYINSNGFNASAYLFDGNLAERQNYAYSTQNHAPHVNDWGLSAGYSMNTPTVGVNFQIDYLNNMAQALYVSHAVVDYGIRAADASATSSYYQRTPGVATHLALTSGPFGLIVDYVTAMRRFAAVDLSTQNTSFLETNLPTKGAKPQATFVQLDYDFNVLGHNSTAYAGYETSKDSQQVYGPDFGGFVMPKMKELIGYKYYVTKTINVNAELNHSKDYSYNGTTTANDAGTGRTSNGMLLGLDVKF